MKTLKKLACILLAVMMVLAMTVPAAADTTAIDTATAKGTITVNAPVEGQTYRIYKILDIDSIRTETGGEETKTYITYSIKKYLDGSSNENNAVLNPWYTFINDVANEYFTMEQVPDGVDDVGFNDNPYDNIYIVEAIVGNGKTAEGLAVLAKNYIDQVNSDNDGTNDIAIVNQIKCGTGGVVKFDELALGYYLMESSLGSLCALVNTDPDAIVYAKNAVPTITKAVKDETGADTSFDVVKTTDTGEATVENKTNVTFIGRTVNFRTIATLGQGSENIVIHDILCDGMELDVNSIKVINSLTGEGEPLNNENNAYYEVKTGVEHSDPSHPHFGQTCTFEIHFKQSFLDSLNLTASGTSLPAPNKLYIYYDAVVQPDALISDSMTSQANVNLTWLSYGEGSNTPDDKTETYLYAFEIFKYTSGQDASGASINAPLAGAVFSIKQQGHDTVLKFMPVDADENGKPANNVWRVPTAAERSEGTLDEHIETEFTTEANGTIRFEGLDLGYYEIYEIAAPEGYSRITEPIQIQITEGGIVKINSAMPSDVGIAALDELNPQNGEGASGHTVPVLNQSGFTLPETGGSGTAAIYIVGGIMVLAAVVFLVTKRRMNAKD